MGGPKETPVWPVQIQDHHWSLTTLCALSLRCQGCTCTQQFQRQATCRSSLMPVLRRKAGGRPDGDFACYQQALSGASLFAVIPFLTGMFPEVDVDGSLVSRTVVITSIGAGVGTVMAGGQFNDLGGVRFGYAMCAGILVAAPFVWYALRAAAAHESTATRVSGLAPATHGRTSAPVPH